MFIFDPPTAKRIEALRRDDMVPTVTFYNAVTPTCSTIFLTHLGEMIINGHDADDGYSNTGKFKSIDDFILMLKHRCNEWDNRGGKLVKQLAFIEAHVTSKQPKMAKFLEELGFDHTEWTAYEKYYHKIRHYIMPAAKFVEVLGKYS